MIPSRRIAKIGTVAWHARSLDLTPISFFLHGYTKDQAYCTRVIHLQDLGWVGGGDTMSILWKESHLKHLTTVSVDLNTSHILSFVY
jgi:hypothetical protein